MAAKKKTRAAKGAVNAADRIRDAWKSAVNAFTRAEAEVEKQVRQLMKGDRAGAKDVSGVLHKVRTRLEHERKKAVKNLQGRLHGLQNRLGKERKALMKTVENTVQRTLSALNVPGRREISELTRKVEDLSKKIDGLRAA
jgi:hypothetical protein